MATRSTQQSNKKEALFFCHADRTTFVMPLKKAIVDFNPSHIYKEGQVVGVRFEGETYDASIIKLHDRTTVLNAADRQFCPETYHIPGEVRPKQPASNQVRNF